MGLGMASNLAKKGNFSVLGYDVYAPSLEKAAANGITPASVREIGEKCDVTVTMLRTPEQVQEVYAEMFEVAGSGKLFIDSSTVDPVTSQNLAASAEAKGCMTVDAPVSGGFAAANAGTLTFMVGGKTPNYERAQEYLGMMGANIYHCGEKPGSGQVAKICNNLILGVTMNAVSEGLNLGVKLGMDAKVLTDIVSVSSGGGWITKNYCPAPGVDEAKPSSNGYVGGFGVDLMLKDLKLAQQAAQTVDQRLQFGGMATDVYQELSETGYGGKDFGIAYQRAKGGLKKEPYSS